MKQKVLKNEKLKQLQVMLDEAKQALAQVREERKLVINTAFTEFRALINSVEIQHTELIDRITEKIDEIKKEQPNGRSDKCIQ